MSLKGYPDRAKLDAGVPNYATVGPVREQQFGLDVISHLTYQVMATDAVEASSTTRVINATAHVAQVGDVISFTSGNLNKNEYRVHAVATNTITVAEAMSEAPATSDTFKILRPKHMVVNSDGELTIAATINNDSNTGLAGSDTLRTVEAGRARGIAPVTNLYSSTNVTTGAWVEIIASTAAEVTSIYVSDTSGSFMILGTGAAASEVAQIYLAPGFSGFIPLRIAASTRVALKALDSDATTGRFIMSGFA